MLLPAAAHRPLPGGQQPAPQRLVIHHQPRRGPMFGHQRRTEVRMAFVLIPPQHLRPQRRRLAPRTGLTPQPRHQTRVALGLITSPDPLGLPGSQAQHLRGLHRGQFLAASRHHNRQPIPFFPAHFQCLQVVAGVATATPPQRGHSHQVPTGKRFRLTSRRSHLHSTTSI